MLGLPNADSMSFVVLHILKMCFKLLLDLMDLLDPVRAVGFIEVVGMVRWRQGCNPKFM